MTALMSHSLKVVRMAAVCCAITSWAAIFRRKGERCLRVTRPSSPAGERRACFRSAGAGASAAARLGDARPPFAGRTVRWARASRRGRWRPGAGLPAAWRRSSLFLRLRRGAGFSAGARRLSRRGGAAFLDHGHHFADLHFGAFGGLDSQDARFFRGDLGGDLVGFQGQQRRRPRCTVSPSFLCQVEMRPLVIDSPTAGMVTSMD